MELSEEQLNLIEDMAKALLPPCDIAILIDIPQDQENLFIQQCKEHKETQIYRAYQRGRLSTKLALRKTIVKLAIAGSPAAEPLANKFISEQNNDK